MKYDEVHVELLIEALQKGATINGACAVGGITRKTYEVWKKTHPEFTEKIEFAIEKWRNLNAKIIQKAALTDWKAAAWLLERRDPENYGRREKVTMENVSPPSEIIIKLAKPPA
jgi:hypothetical protein